MGTHTRRRLGIAAYHVIVSGISLIMIYPLVWMVMSPSKETSTISTAATNLIPEISIPENYMNGWKGFTEASFSVFFRNSLFISVLTVVGTLCSSAIVVFGFTRRKFPGEKFLFTAILASMMLPAQVLMIPQYLWYQKLHWVDTYLSLIVPYCFAAQGFFVYMMTNFIEGIPMKLDGSVKIDGCPYYGTFLRIILSLLRPALITGHIFPFIWRQDDLLGSLLYINSTEKYPVNLALKLFSDPGSSFDYGAMFAMAAPSTLPAVLIPLFPQKHLVEGIATSRIKGQEITHNGFSPHLFREMSIL